MLDLHTHLPFDNKTGDRSLRFSFWCCLRIDQKIVCTLCPHNETFLAIEDIIIPYFLCEGSGTEEIGPATRLGECLGTAEFPLKGGFQIFGLLFQSAKMMDRLAHNTYQ